MRLHASKLWRTSSRRSLSSTLTKRHGWLLPTDGASSASAISRSTSAFVQWVGAKAPDVASPAEQLFELAAEGGVEARRANGQSLIDHGFGHSNRVAASRKVRWPTSAAFAIGRAAATSHLIA